MKDRTDIMIKLGQTKERLKELQNKIRTEEYLLNNLEAALKNKGPRRFLIHEAEEPKRLMISGADNWNKFSILEVFDECVPQEGFILVEEVTDEKV